MNPSTLTSETIWQTFAPDLKRYVFSQAKDEDLTNDILQEVFIKIHLNIEKLNDKNKVKSWVFAIAHNTLMNFFNKKNIPFPIDEVGELMLTEDEIHSANNCLIPLINNLPKRYSEPLLLSEIQGKKLAEVATILEISLSGAKSRVQRGRKLLQQEYMDCCHYKLNEEGFLVGEHQDKKNCKKCSHE